MEIKKEKKGLYKLHYNEVSDELLFYNTLNQISNSSSSKCKYSYFCDFIQRTNHNRNLVPDVERLSRLLSINTEPLCWFGISPEELTSILQTMDSLSFSLPVKLFQENIFPHIQWLREILVLQYSFLNDPERLDEQLRSLLPKSYPKDYIPLRQIDSVELKQLKSLLLSMEMGADFPIVEMRSRERLLQNLNVIVSNQLNHLYLPVVESQSMALSSTDPNGRLRKLYIDFLSECAASDTLLLQYQTHLSESPSIANFEEYLHAARVLAEEMDPAVKCSFCKGMAYYKMNSIKHAGTSNHLALSLLWFSTLMNSISKRYTVSFISDTAFTGGVDASGNILPVSLQSVKPKCKAVFYSPCRQLVVPDNQFSLFEKETNSLKQLYPNKPFTLHGASTLREIFDEPNLTIIAQNSSSIAGKLRDLIVGKK